MLIGKGQLIRDVRMCGRLRAPGVGGHPRPPSGGSQLMETRVLVGQEEPGARSHGTAHGSEPLEPCRLACSLPNDP